jgi:hypothetical protein
MEGMIVAEVLMSSSQVLEIVSCRNIRKIAYKIRSKMVGSFPRPYASRNYVHRTILGEQI